LIVPRAKGNQVQANRMNDKIHSTFDGQRERQPGVSGKNYGLKATLANLSALFFGQHPVVAVTAAVFDRTRFVSSRSALFAEFKSRGVVFVVFIVVVGFVANILLLPQCYSLAVGVRSAAKRKEHDHLRILHATSLRFLQFATLTGLSFLSCLPLALN
jgi:hypothetical protein